MPYLPGQDGKQRWSAELAGLMAEAFGWVESGSKESSQNSLEDEDWEDQFSWMIAAEFGWNLNFEPPVSGSLYDVPLNQSRQETRLVTVLPGKGSEISCTLRTVSLTDNPKFNALSYIWGDPYDTQNIKVNGMNVSVTKNLESALRRIRQFESGKYAINIWIDALCINQTDPMDKSYQIPLMNQIYSSAKTVVAWLGQWGSSIDRTFDIYRQVSENKCKNIVDQSVLTRALSVTAEINWHPYWQRLWVVQELCLAKSSPILLSGQNHIFLDQLLDSLQAIGTNAVTGSLVTSEFVSPVPRVNAQNLKEYLAMRTGTFNMQSIMHLRTLLQDEKQINITGYVIKATVFRKTSNPADRVYALLGMLDQSTRSKFLINYEADYMSVYQDLFSLLWTSDSVESFPFILFSPSHRAGSQYPSWVPDLCNQNDKIFFPGPDREFTRWMGGSSASLSDDGRFIFADGIWMGEVIFASSCEFSVPDGRLFDDLQELLSSQLIQSLSSLHHGITARIHDPAAFAFASSDTSDEELLARQIFPFLRIFESAIPSMAITMSFKSAVRGFLFNKEWFVNFWNTVIASLDPIRQAEAYFTSSNEDERNMMLFYLSTIGKITEVEFCERKVFCTKYGIIGTAPKEIKEGDLLVKLHSFSEIMILRRAPAGHFTIIGSVAILRYEDNGQRIMKHLLDKGKIKIQRIKIG